MHEANYQGALCALHRVVIEYPTPSMTISFDERVDHLYFSSLYDSDDTGVLRKL
jgi:hypothetical protein